MLPGPLLITQRVETNAFLMPCDFRLRGLAPPIYGNVCFSTYLFKKTNNKVKSVCFEAEKQTNYFSD